MYITFGDKLLCDGVTVTAPGYTPAAGYGTTLAHTVESLERRIVYCWLWGTDNISFWFYPVKIHGGKLDGFAWINGHWAKIRMPARQVKNYFC